MSTVVLPKEDTVDDERVIVGIADIKVAKDPAVIMTNLGSCVAVCLYEPTMRVGGMLHLMMASSGNKKDEPDLKKAKYADTGIAELIAHMRRSFGVSEGNLVAKFFGGAKILEKVTRDIGKENEEAVRTILKSHGIPVRASKTGGPRGYKVSFFTATGKVECQIFGEKIEEY